MRGSAAFRTGVAPGGALAPGWVKNELWSKARAIPSLDLRFADNKSLVDATTGAQLVTFTRASSGTFVGSDGLLQTAVTNLLLRSEEFDNAGWAKSSATVTANTIVSPNGTVTADTITDSSDGAATAHIVNTPNQSFVSGLTYTISVYAQAGTLAGVSFIFLSTAFTSNLNARFNISTGTIQNLDAGLTGSIAAVGNSWYRCSVTATATATASSSIQIRTANASTSFYQGNGTGTIFLWGAQLEQSSTVGEYIPTTSTINSAPRFDHNPTTGESLGLLVEEQRTNGIRNNTGVGAVAGTPGTLPTNWSTFTSLTGLTQQIVGTGTENGITYIDIKLSGTPSAAGSFFINTETSTQVAAANGQTWTSSAYFKLQAGTTTGLGGFSINVSPRDTLGNTVGNASTAFTPTTGALITQRVSSTIANNSALTVYELQFIQFSLSGAAIDITLRIGLPQLEQGAFVTSPILTTTAAATRSADVASITGSAFTGFYRQDEGSLYCSFSTPAGDTTNNRGIVALDDNSNNNRISLFIPNTAAPLAVAARIVSGGTATNPANLGSITLNSQARVIQTYGVGTNQAALSVDGVLPTTASPLTAPVGVNQLAIGRITFVTQIGGHIRRLCYWPTRLANNTLQSITQ